MSTPTLIDRARALLALAPHTTPRPWSWWTSCSWRRLSSDVTRRDGDVLTPTNHPIDHHPDVICREEDRDWIEGASNAAEPLAAFALAFAEALPGLYREHGGGCHHWVEGDDGREWCACGADAHNARLDALADKLGIPAEERRRAPGATIARAMSEQTTTLAPAGPPTITLGEPGLVGQIIEIEGARYEAVRVKCEACAGRDRFCPACGGVLLRWEASSR